MSLRFNAMSGIKESGLTQFDAAAYVVTPELIREYFNAALAENDSAFLVEALETVARAPGMEGRSALTPPALDARGGTEFETVARVVASMGLKLQVVAA